MGLGLKIGGHKMKLVVGLGNPGRQYENTRHNIGFMVIDDLLETTDLISTTTKFNANITDARLDGEKVLFVKPLTYMNLSGEAVRPILDWYKIDIKDMVVIYDDLDLPLGKLRFREKGSAGGHNGIKSMIQNLETEEFKRIRIGIDRPEYASIIDHVLTKFSSEEKEVINESIQKAALAIKDWISGIEFKMLMNKYH